MKPSLRITVLVENRSVRDDVSAEHGLSLWVEADGLRLLFDTGQSGAFLSNARVLGVPVQEADALVLSHGHCDHSGGLADLPVDWMPSRLYLHPQACIDRYARGEHGDLRPIGMPPASAAALRGMTERVTWTPSLTPITERIGVTGSIPRNTDFEDVGGPFFLDPEGLRPDPIADDQAVWVETEKGIVVLLGCAHAGAVNTLAHLSSLLGVTRIHAAIGGMHLLHASANRIARTADRLNCYGVNLLGLGHCTGDSAIEHLASHCSGKVVPLSTGTALEL